MHADHHERIVHGIFEFAGDGTHDRREPVGGNVASGRMEPAADDPHDEHQFAAGNKAADAGAVDRSDGSGRAYADESLVVY